MNFTDLISTELAERLAARGITEPSPIQAEALPHALSGRDVVGRARTGTGKTLAFALPIISRLNPSRERGRAPRAIIMAPTRELARQVAEEFSKSGPELTVTTVYGGASYGPQENALRRGVDVVVGTPGRVIDHLERGNLDLSQIEYAVLDEADEMLSVGFADAIEQILSATPRERQTMLFSATLPDGVNRIMRSYLREPVTVDLVGEDRMQAATSVEHLKVKVGRTRTRVLADLLTVYAPERAIVFTRTKKEADELALELIHRGIEAEGLHGDLAQSQRERALGRFRAGGVGVLVATDVAARGLDIPQIDLVVQYHLPQDPESYVHRSGRTGRAGRTGTAIVMYGEREGRDMRGLEHQTGVKFVERGLPTPKEVREASAKASADLVRHVDAGYAAPFMAEAEALIADLGAEALARALAKIAGAVTPVQTASLLSGEEGMVTVMLEAERMSVPRAVALVARSTNVDTRRLGKVRLFAGGAVMDLPQELLPELLKAGPLDGGVKVSVAEELPELFEEPTREGRGGRSGGYQGGSRGRSYGDREGRGYQGGGRGGSSGGRRYASDRGNDRPSRGGYSDREFVPRDRDNR